jgi:hypothetical protein
MAESKLQRSGRMADPRDQPNGEPDGAATPPEKTPPAKAAKKAPAKKAPAKKAAAKKAADPGAAPKPPEVQQHPQPVIEPVVEIAAAAKDAAAQAKSTVEGANNPVRANVSQSIAGQAALPLAVAVALSLLAILLIRQLRQH